LAVSYILLSVLPLMVFYYSAFNTIETYNIEARIGGMRDAATVVADSVAFNFGDFSDEALMRRLREDTDRRSQENGYRVLVLNEHCRVVDDSNRNTNISLVGRTLLVPEVINALTNRAATMLRRDEEAVYSASAIQNNENVVIGAVLLVASVEDVYEQLQDVRNTILLYSLMVVLFIFVLVFFVSKLLLEPLKNILQVVLRMSRGYLNQRIRQKGRDEYSQLALAFNNMTEKLEQVEKTREEFVSNVSHELKTPLSSMKVLSESLLLQEEVPVDMYREFLQDITSEVDRMTLIVNDLLELVKIDQRELSVHFAQTELNALVEGILKRLSPLAEQQGIVLLYEDVRAVLIDADEMKLSLAISNIVENGIKYTPRGGTVKVIVDADHQNAFITIQDTGIGIAEEEQGKVFNRFYRVDKTRDRETGGTGLGLAISHSTVLLHNGSIRLNSKPEEGTVFIIRIPIRRN
jgi:signal transduction histidine kinase